ncbi:hypothetical protein PoB_002743000 [Plakobranchus ocellatus]|uniref:Uncharacterized protein n=1 Tax=Plakobranchus ocellatus TaxID=259542 RepID=A0AAV3ZYI6_9GAST|nr:hypothetical protein PoB_002743000 [Plakobranchus ocellatus]
MRAAPNPRSDASVLRTNLSLTSGNRRTGLDVTATFNELSPYESTDHQYSPPRCPHSSFFIARVSVAPEFIIRMASLETRSDSPSSQTPSSECPPSLQGSASSLYSGRSLRSTGPSPYPGRCLAVVSWVEGRKW